MFLRAQQALTQGNIEPLKIFTQKKEARWWTLKDKEIPVINSKGASGYRIETYEPKEGEDVPRIPDEVRRIATIDMQRDRFPLLIKAYSPGRSRVLMYEEPSTEEDLVAILAQYGLQTGHVGFDVGNWSKDALRLCFKHSWVPLRGRDIRNFTKTRGKRVPVKTRWQAVKEYLTGEKIYGAGTTINVFEWSNIYFKDIFSRLRMMPEHEIPDDICQLYIDAMESEAKDAKGVWRQIGKRANHPWDDECMNIFMAWRFGLIGEVEEPDEPEDESDH